MKFMMQEFARQRRDISSALALLALGAMLCTLTFVSLAEAAIILDSQAQQADVLEGLDPVMLLQGKEVQGDLKITVVRGQFRYLFANEANKATFEKDPARYEIQLGGACARMGMPVTGNPDLYAVHDGRIYIFGSEECKKRFVAAPQKFLEPTTNELSKTAATPEDVKKGQALIQKAVAALGGEAKIDSLVSYHEKSIAPQIRGRNGETEVKVNNDLLVVFPNRIRLEQVMPDFGNPSATRRQTTVIAPGESFGITSRGVVPLPNGVREAQEKELKRRPLSILRARKSASFKATAVGAVQAGEMSVEQVAVEFDGLNYILGIDPAMGRILSVSQRRRGPIGEYGLFVQTFSDFRAVNGLTLPFKMTATFDGQPWKDQSATVEEIVINGKIDSALFEKPKANGGQ